MPNSRGSPGTLHRRPWRDFGHNRSELMSLARGSADWLLLLDADQEVRQVEFLPPLDSGAVDAYRLRHAGGIEYDIPRLVRGDLPWRFEGRTHEYLTCDDRATTSVLLPAWEIVHHGDGSSTLAEVRAGPRTAGGDARGAAPMMPGRSSTWPRPWSRSVSRRQQREHYRRRAGLGGFEEEAWFAQWHAAALLPRQRIRPLRSVSCSPPGRDALPGWSRSTTRSSCAWSMAG